MIPNEPVSIAVFARAPIPGQTKTRLIPRLGAEGAARLQESLLRRTLATTTAAGLGPVSLWCTPSSAHPLFRAVRKEWALPLFDQEGLDLGERMLHAFERLCPRGPALLVGTDCPALTGTTLARAALALHEGNDAVLVPAEDGGYVLIGLRRAETRVFYGISWGSDQVMAETRRRLSRLGWRWAEPDTSWDVDRPEDLDRLEASGLLDWKP